MEWPSRVATALVPMVQISIEYARRVHSAEIDALEARSFTIRGELLETVRRSRRQEPGVRLVAIAEGHVAGYLAGTWLFETPRQRLRSLCVIALAVDKPFRRVGIGHRLLTTLFERGCARGALRYYLSVQVENAGAIALYEATGFMRRSHNPDSYGPGRDGITMVREARPEDRRPPPGPTPRSEG